MPATVLTVFISNQLHITDVFAKAHFVVNFGWDELRLGVWDRAFFKKAQNI